MYSGVPMIPRDAGPLAEVTSDRSALTIFARPKVADLHETVFAARLTLLLHQEDVRRLQIAMKYSLIVGRFDARDDLAA
jgi:hypothetical protein